MSNKENSIRNRLINSNVGIGLLLETKKDNCCDSFIRNLWNIITFKLVFLESVGKLGGITVMRDISIFKVNTIDFGGSGSAHMLTLPLNVCMVVGVYATTFV
jgi:hypothetical protein